MDVSILKPETLNKKAAIISRPSNSRTTASSSQQSAPKSPEDSSDRAPLINYTEPVSDDEDDDENDPQQVTYDESQVAGISAVEAAEARAYREQHKSDSPLQSLQPASATGEQNFPKLTPQNLERLLKAKYHQDGEDEQANRAPPPVSPGLQFVQSFTAPKGKQIAVPIRVEPKVYFANGMSSLVGIDVLVSSKCSLDSQSELSWYDRPFSAASSCDGFD